MHINNNNNNNNNNNIIIIIIQAVLEEIKSAKLLENARITGKFLLDGLVDLQVPDVVDVVVFINTIPTIDALPGYPCRSTWCWYIPRSRRADGC